MDENQKIETRRFEALAALLPAGAQARLPACCQDSTSLAMINIGDLPGDHGQPYRLFHLVVLRGNVRIVVSLKVAVDVGDDLLHPCLGHGWQKNIVRARSAKRCHLRSSANFWHKSNSCHYNKAKAS